MNSRNNNRFFKYAKPLTIRIMDWGNQGLQDIGIIKYSKRYFVVERIHSDDCHFQWPWHNLKSADGFENFPNAEKSLNRYFSLIPKIKSCLEDMCKLRKD